MNSVLQEKSEDEQGAYFHAGNFFSAPSKSLFRGDSSMATTTERWLM